MTSPTTKVKFVYSEIRYGNLIAVRQDGKNFTFEITDDMGGTYGSTHLSVEEAIEAAIAESEARHRWELGFSAYENGEVLRLDKDPDFTEGWRAAEDCYNP